MPQVENVITVSKALAAREGTFVFAPPGQMPVLFSAFERSDGAYDCSYYLLEKPDDHKPYKFSFIDNPCWELPRNLGEAFQASLEGIYGLDTTLDVDVAHIALISPIGTCADDIACFAEDLELLDVGSLEELCESAIHRVDSVLMGRGRFWTPLMNDEGVQSWYRAYDGTYDLNLCIQSDPDALEFGKATMFFESALAGEPNPDDIITVGFVSDPNDSDQVDAMKRRADEVASILSATNMREGTLSLYANGLGIEPYVAGYSLKTPIGRLSVKPSGDPGSFDDVDIDFLAPDGRSVQIAVVGVKTNEGASEVYCKTFDGLHEDPVFETTVATGADAFWYEPPAHFDEPMPSVDAAARIADSAVIRASRISNGIEQEATFDAFDGMKYRATVTFSSGRGDFSVSLLRLRDHLNIKVPPYDQPVNDLTSAKRVLQELVNKAMIGAPDVMRALSSHALITQTPHKASPDIAPRL